MTLERIAPDGSCVDPVGHAMVDIRSMSSRIPVRIICRRCGKSGTVIVFDDEDANR